MRMKIRTILCVVVCFVALLSAQDQARIMTYNLLNYTTSDTSRDAAFRTVVQQANPDILVVQEITSQAAVNQFHTKVLNSVFPDAFTAGGFINGFDTDNAIYFRSSLFAFLSNTPIQTALRDINEFKLVHTATSETLRVYSVHLKSSTGSDNEAKRAAEVDSLRKFTNALATGTSFIVVGDFNIYKSDEQAYQKLIQQDVANDGHFIDPITMTGTWNNVAYAAYHTQSPRLRQFGGGANGGLDDRFDMILYSQAVSASGGVTFVPGSYVVMGNDGNHYNDSINKMPNTVVTQAVAQALHDASDHLPVYATFTFEHSGLPVQLTSFTATTSISSVDLKWTTATEVRNYGFEIERRLVQSFKSKVSSSTLDLQLETWNYVGFVQGSGTSTSPQEYTFVDQKLAPGRYAYRIKQIDNDGSFAYFSAAEVEIGIAPNMFALGQNYPNPFNPETTIEFTLPSDGPAVLKVYDMLGQEVTTLFNEEAVAGRMYQTRFDGSSLPSGAYFYTLSHRGQQQVRKLLLVR
jgi:endonuclease/exonuclease/phosphatase family metal-dependent hydrolase